MSDDLDFAGPADDDDDAQAPPVPDGSVWAQLRDEHAALAEGPPLDLDVPGYSGLQIRFQFVPLADTERTTQKLAKLRSLTEQALYGSMDTLILACAEFRVLRPTDPRADKKGYAPLADAGQPPVRFNHALAKGMGWPDELKAREIVERLFGGEMGHYLIMEMAREVSEWNSDVREGTAEEFLGK